MISKIYPDIVRTVHIFKFKEANIRDITLAIL
jgi:hypothetical protein